MSDFSTFSLFTAGLALFAPLTAAWTQPVGDAPKGNAIYQPGLASIVPAGKPFTIEWDPTTKGTVTLVLLKGPSENAVPQYAIAEKIPNDGLYDWTPKKDLEPTEGDTGYGIQLIVDSNGQYQYTTQFGISNPAYNEEEVETTSEVAKPTVTAAQGYKTEGASHGKPHGGHGHGAHDVHSGYTHPAAPSGSGSAAPSGWATHKSNSTSTHSAKHTSAPWASQNVTMVSATDDYKTSTPIATYESEPTGAAAPTNSTPSVPTSDNGASGSAVASFGGLVLAAAALVFAL